MKVIIAGGRHFSDLMTVNRALAAFQDEHDTEITEIVSGGATGADRLGETWARRAHIPIKKYPAEWKKHGRKAGPIRNGVMAAYADALVAFWDGESPGTKDMIQQAKALGLIVKVVHYTPLAAYHPGT